MAIEPLPIEWQLQPLQVDQAAAKAFIIKNPLLVLTKGLGFYEPTIE